MECTVPSLICRKNWAFLAVRFDAPVLVSQQRFTFRLESQRGRFANLGVPILEVTERPTEVSPPGTFFLYQSPADRRIADEAQRQFCAPRNSCIVAVSALSCM